ncbi:hypothetical protein BC629DRAFT_1174699 [Irpex lacteus]|nr:hypothetical protein BC629DRAFT_1174699 [Irpex lacteus]
MDRLDDSPLPPFTSPLYNFEAEWANRYRFLNDHGYQLRPRYVPNRAPDWAAKGADAVHCEDAIPAPVLRPHLMDATRNSDGKLVYIKRLSHGENEIRIAQMLSPLSSAPDPQNHSVPILEVVDILPATPSSPVGSAGPCEDRYLRPKRNPSEADASQEGGSKGPTEVAQPEVVQEAATTLPVSDRSDRVLHMGKLTEGELPDDDAEPGVLRNDVDDLTIASEDAELGDDDQHTAYLVMPFLLPVTEVPFETVDNLIDFIDQILEGLVYMHSRGVAHRDCCLKNIMMDADALCPQGFHPVHLGSLPDGFTPAPCLPRSAAPVKYYFVDYGISSYIDPNGQEDRKVVGVHGIDQEVPELSLTVPYDPFKVDIFLIGNMFKHELYMVR